MELLTLFSIALGLSMDAFAVSISNLLFYKNFTKKQAVLSAFTFGIFQGIMPVIGYFAGSLFFDIISKLDHWIAFFLLLYIGMDMILDAIKEMRKNPNNSVVTSNQYTVKTLLLQGVATSIDALAIGISFAALNINIITASIFICLTTFICCLLASFLGKKFGNLLQEKAKIFGGAVLVLIGIKILVEHTIF